MLSITLLTSLLKICYYILQIICLVCLETRYLFNEEGIWPTAYKLSSFWMVCVGGCSQVTLVRWLRYTASIIYSLSDSNLLSWRDNIPKNLWIPKLSFAMAWKVAKWVFKVSYKIINNVAGIYAQNVIKW